MFPRIPRFLLRSMYSSASWSSSRMAILVSSVELLTIISLIIRCSSKSEEGREKCGRWCGGRLAVCRPHGRDPLRYPALTDQTQAARSSNLNGSGCSPVEPDARDPFRSSVPCELLPGRPRCLIERPVRPADPRCPARTKLLAAKCFPTLPSQFLRRTCARSSPPPFACRGSHSSNLVSVHVLHLNLQ